MLVVMTLKVKHPEFTEEVVLNDLSLTYFLMFIAPKLCFSMVKILLFPQIELYAFHESPVCCFQLLYLPSLLIVLYNKTVYETNSKI